MLENDEVSFIFTDEQLAYLFQHGDDTAESTLFHRYKIFSRALAKELLHDFGDTTICDVDDLTNIGLYAVHIAIGGYEEKTGTFKTYWKTIAKNEMMQCIKETSTSYKAKRFKQPSLRQSSYGIPVHSSSITSESDFLNTQIFELLSNPKNGFTVTDVEIFKDFLDGYNSSEIARKIGLRDHYVRKRLNKIREFLSHILLNS